MADAPCEFTMRKRKRIQYEDFPDNTSAHHVEKRKEKNATLRSCSLIPEIATLGSEGTSDPISHAEELSSDMIIPEDPETPRLNTKTRSKHEDDDREQTVTVERFLSFRARKSSKRYGNRRQRTRTVAQGARAESSSNANSTHGGLSSDPVQPWSSSPAPATHESREGKSKQTNSSFMRRLMHANVLSHGQLNETLDAQRGTDAAPLQFNTSHGESTQVTNSAVSKLRPITSFKPQIPISCWPRNSHARKPVPSTSRMARSFKNTVFSKPTRTPVVFPVEQDRPSKSRDGSSASKEATKTIRIAPAPTKYISRTCATSASVDIPEGVVLPPQTKAGHSSKTSTTSTSSHSRSLIIDTSTSYHQVVAPAPAARKSTTIRARSSDVSTSSSTSRRTSTFPKPTPNTKPMKPLGCYMDTLIATARSFEIMQAETNAKGYSNGLIPKSKSNSLQQRKMTDEHPKNLTRQSSSVHGVSSNTARYEIRRPDSDTDEFEYLFGPDPDKEIENEVADTSLSSEVFYSAAHSF